MVNIFAHPVVKINSITVHSSVKIFENKKVMWTETKSLKSEVTLRETTRVLVAENRWSLPEAGATRKGVRMALLSQEPPGLAPNRRVLPLVVVVY